MRARASGRKSRIRSFVGVCLVLATVLAVGQSASATEGRTTTTPKLWSFASAFNVDSTDAILARFIQFRDTYCPPGKPIAVSMTLRQALASARQYVINKAGASAVSAFDHSTTAQSAAQSRAAAVGMFAGRKPLPALLALLRTHQLVPGDPSILSGISAVLNVLGLGKQSLVVAKAADAMASTPTPAMGISGQAMLLNNEGHAMLLLRRWAAAEQVLRQAVTLSPELAEAKVNLALALLCQHEDEDAVKFYRLGQYRKPYDLVQLGDQPGAQSVPVAEEVFDLSHGVTAAYPSLPIPETWVGDNTYDAFLQWKALDDSFVNQQFAQAAEVERIREQVAWGSWSVLSNLRYLAVLYGIYESNRQPTLKPLYDAWQADVNTLGAFNTTYRQQVDAMAAATSTWPECTGPNATTQSCQARWQTECSAHNDAAHAAWLPLMHRFDSDLRTYESARYRFETALVANLGEPHLYAYVAAEQRYVWMGDFDDLIWQLLAWSQNLLHSSCSPTAPTDDAPEAQGGTTNDPVAGCAPFLAGVKFSVKLGDFVKVSTNCEQIGLEVASKSDIVWVGGFAEGSFNFVKGQGTIFAGLKGGGKVPETGISVSAKEGIYLTVGSSGIKDVGMRVSTTAAFGLAGGPTVDMKGFGYSISFVSQTIAF